MVETVTAARTSCGAVACEQACETGDARACVRAAELSWDGQDGHAFDPSAALRYATRGCHDGDALACALVGRHHANGIATPWAPATALNVFKKACEGGAGLGCLEVGNMYAQGHGIDVDLGKAASYLLRAQERFRAACMGSEPRWCRYVDVGNDSELGERLAQRACTSGIASGCVQVLVGRIGDRLNASEFGILDRMCTAGERTACVALARTFVRADVPAATARAVALMSRACELGDPDGCLHIGLLEEAADSTSRVNDAKRNHFERACARASGRACLYLAEDHFVDGHATRVAEYAERACELGQASGCTMMVRNQLEQGDDAGADRWAREGCRRGASYDCERLIERDLELPWLRGREKKRLYRRGCGGGSAPACRRLAAIALAEEPVLAALRDAVTRGDTAAFARLTPGEVSLRDLWFEDAGCMSQFDRGGALTAAGRAGLLKCLAEHGLRLEPKASVEGTAALVLDPGVVLELGIAGGEIEEISAPELWPPQHEAAPISRDALASHLIDGALTVEPTADVRAAIASTPGGVAGVDLVVCVDPTGKVADAHASPARGGVAYRSYVQAVEKVAAQWRFKPFTVHGKAVPVCTLDVFAYPADRRRELMLASAAGALRPDPGVRPNVAPTILDANRIAGHRNIVPDDVTKTEISRSLKSKLVGSFKLCIDVAGRIGSISQLKSTGFPAYDREIQNGIRTWRYRPIWIGGRPTAVCTAVTFIYSQH